MAVALASALLSGCGGEGDADAAAGAADPLVRDSAGVAVVLHRGDPADTVRVADEPSVRIGREGDPDYELFRVADVVALGSGNVVVANGGTRELRFYGPEGTHLRTVAGQGEGPSELGFLSRVWLRPGDTLAALDPRRRRVLVFDSAGAYRRAVPFAEDFDSEMPPDATMCVFPSLAGLLQDGARVTFGWGCLRLRGSDGERSYETTVTVVRDDGRDTLGTFDVMGVWERAGAEDPREAYTVLPFGPTPSYTAAGERFFLTSGRDHRVRVYDGRGRLVRTFGEERERPAVAAEDRDRFGADWAEARGEPYPDEVPFPDRFPAYDRMVRARNGDLWLRHGAPPGAAAHRWTVYSPDGGTRGHARTPAVQVEAVSDRRVWAVRTDSLGVQTVVGYDLVR